MKKILFVAFAATLLAAGCQKTEVINPVGNSIGFTTELGKITKGLGDAEDEGVDNLQAQGILVSAFYVENDPNKAGATAGTAYDGMDEASLTYSIAEGATTGEWTPDKDYYWPGKSKYLNFFAVSGLLKGDKYELDKDAVKIENTGITIDSFTVNEKNANVDLMVADVVLQSQDVKMNVKLNFRHALSKVEFIFKTTADTKETIFVQHLVVDGLHKANKLVAQPAAQIATGQNEVKLSWDKLTTEGNVSFVDDYDVQFVDTDKVKYPATITPDAAAPENLNNESMWLNPEDANKQNIDPFTTWLMIPQPITGKTVKVTYLIDGRQFVAIFPLDIDGKLTEWAPNQYVKYTVTLAPNKIKFSPEVLPWTPIVDVDPEMGVINPDPTPDPTTPNSVVATLGETQVTLYYEGELAAETEVFTNAELTQAAEAGDYTLADGRVVTVSEGKVTAVTINNTPEEGE